MAGSETQEPFRNLLGAFPSGAAAFARPVVRELVERPRSVTRSNTGERSPQPSVGSGG